MQNKVVIFGRNTKKVEEILLDRGVLEYIVCQDFDDCLSVCKSVYERSEEIVVLCNNDQIDSFVEKLKTQEDNLSLINLVLLNEQILLQVILNLLFLLFL